MVTTVPEQLSTIGHLVLVRLLIGGDKGDTVAKIKKDLEPLLVHRWTGVILTERINGALAELESNSLVTIVRGKSKKSVVRIVLTDNGRHHGLDFLGVVRLQPKTTWAKLKKIYLPARALGLAASTDAAIKALSSEPGFKAILLRRQFGLRTTALPRLDEALDALAWQLIGFGDLPQKFDLRSVKTALFNREIGDGRATDFKKAAAQLLARKVAARRDDPRELRDAVLRGWIDHDESELTEPDLAEQSDTIAPREQPTPCPVPQLHKLDLPSFAELVKSAARTCPTGRFGDNKVFIVHVWRALKVVPPFQSMELASFKEQLAAANNARLLDLSRADLVQAMNPDDIRQSEVHYFNATFHFIRI
jgi:hypothetical protein